VNTATSKPIVSTASNAWDLIKGEAAGAASLALASAATQLQTYAEKAVSQGASGLKTSATSTQLGRGILSDLGLGGVPTGVLVAGAVLVAILVLR
jgi:hypothetical protein